MNSENTSVTRVSQVKNIPVQGSAEGFLVVLYGPDIGRRYFLHPTESLIGRSQSSRIHIDHDSVSRRHARVVCTHKGVEIVDAHSTNGTYVNHVRVARSILKDGDVVRVGDVVLKYLVGDNIEARYHEEIYRLSTLDGLTGVYNKRCFAEALEKEIERAVRYQRVVSLLMFDVDHFKKINDTYGHLAGDHVLRELGVLLLTHTRKQDIPARYGGEEFAVISPENDAQGTAFLAEKLRSTVALHVFCYRDTAIPVTVSVGVATWDNAAHPQGEAETLTAQADAYLMHAKKTGRNRVCGAFNVGILPNT